MNRLTVSIRGPRGRVRQALVEIADGLVLGDDDSAAVWFPGVRLVVSRSEEGWSLSGHALVTGRRLSFRVGDVEVTVEPEVSGHGHARPGVDPTLVVAFFALLLLASAIGVGQRLWAAHQTPPPPPEAPP